MAIKDLSEIVYQEDLENIKKCITIEAEKISVDWHEFVYRYSIERRGEDKINLYGKIISALIKLDIFSLDSGGNFILMSGETSLNPRNSLYNLYFTKKEYALDYKEARYNNNPNITITKMG